MIWWFEKMGRFDVRVDSFPGRRYPPSTVVTGVGGGHDVDVRQFAQDGVQVVGHLRGVVDGTLSIEPNANQSWMTRIKLAAMSFLQLTSLHLAWGCTLPNQPRISISAIRGLASCDRLICEKRISGQLFGQRVIASTTIGLTSQSWTTGRRFRIEVSHYARA